MEKTLIDDMAIKMMSGKWPFYGRKKEQKGNL